MFTALTILFGVAGLLLIPFYPWAGVALIGLVFSVRSAADGDEEGFITCLVVFAALVAACLVAQYAWQHYTADTEAVFNAK